MKRILVTGGAGFIGSHTVDLLVERGYEVRAIDNLEPQVHGSKKEMPEYYNRDATFIYGDVRKRENLRKAIENVDAVLHLAAAVGVGQSMYQIQKYVAYNTYGTSVLLDVLVNEEHDVKKLVVASSMSIYGEGKYLCQECGPVYPGLRREEQLKRMEWELRCVNCGNTLIPASTDERKLPTPTSIYAQTKRHEEEMCLLIGKAYGIPTIALRYFNVYGTRQSLNNPYTGVCAVFSTRILNKKPPYIFENGKQMRDFVHVKDVARANVLALEQNRANYLPVNIGSGKPTSIIELAETLIRLYDGKVQPILSNSFRNGDIRHCFADISTAQKYLNYKPSISLQNGLKEIVEWSRTHKLVAMDRFDESIKELKERGLIRHA